MRGALRRIIQVLPIAVHHERGIAAWLSRTRLRPECAFSSQPTLAEPVKLISLMRSSFSASHAVSASASVKMASASSGQPAFKMTSPSAKAVNGVCGAGFTITGQPAAMAGATLCATRFNGKLNGVIARTGPMPNRCTRPQRPSLPSVKSSGMSLRPFARPLRQRS